MLLKVMTRSFYRLKELHRYTQLNPIRNFHCGSCLKVPRHIASKPTDQTKTNSNLSPAIANKYKIINETDSPIIENTEEETHLENVHFFNDEFEGINLKRGERGVFDIEDLIDLLQRENSKNVFVATVPQEINYVDYIVIASGRSSRHILALAEFIRKVYKRKCAKNDLIPRIEGKSSNEWMALDLGNIALHIFSEKARKIYDLETLWAVGSEYDEQMIKKNEVVDIFQNYSTYLKDLKPID